MTCYYCQKEGRSTPEAGSCGLCSKDICTYPPMWRVDGVFHGDECRCEDCGLLICDPHMSRHSRGRHGTDPSRCFPNSGFSAGVGALVAAGTLLYGRQPPELVSDPSQIQAMSRLLISMVPGATALADVLSGRPSESWTWDRQTLAETGEPLIQFHRPFFTRPMVAGIFILAARTAGASWYYGGRRERMAAEHRLTAEQTRSLDSMASLDRYSGRPLNEDVVMPWMPERDFGQAREIAESLSRLDMPWEPEQVALWIDRTDSGTATEPAAVGGGHMGGAVGVATGTSGGEREEDRAATESGVKEEAGVGSRR